MNKISLPLDIIVIDDNEDNLRHIEALLRKESADFDEFAFKINIIKILAETVDERLDENKILNCIKGTQPCVAIVDIRLEGDDANDYSGIDLLLKINAIYPECRIILVSSYIKKTELLIFQKNYLNIFDSTIDRGQGFEKYSTELLEKFKGALHTYASIFNNRRERFIKDVNNGSKTMWGITIGPNQTGTKTDHTLPIPFLYSNSVMVEVHEIGICATNRQALGKEKSPEYTLIDFHEAFGKVIWTGERVRHIAIGDFVIPMVRRCSPWDMPEKGSEISPNSYHFFPCYNKNRGDCYPKADECPHEEYNSPNEDKRIGYKSRGTGKCHGFGSRYFIDHEDWLIRIDPKGMKDEELRKYMMGRYILTEPLSIAWKMRRQIMKHRLIREFGEKVLFIGLGPIGLLSAMVMTYLHPHLHYTAIDLADKKNARVSILKTLNKSIRYFKAIKDNEAPEELKSERFHIIIEATGHSENIFNYAPRLLAAGGILVMLSVSEKDTHLPIQSDIFTQLVKGNQILIGSVNSSRIDFEDSIAFMEKVIGNRESILEKMITPWEIDDNISEKIINILGDIEPKDRDVIKVVLRAKEYTDSLKVH